MTIEVQFIAHSSIFIKTEDHGILCDPWYVGASFNDAWELAPKPTLENLDLSEVTHIWISHEHPDHFSFPTLKMLSEKLNMESVEFLFQNTNSDKVFNAMKKLGFKKFRTMDHLKPIAINDKLELFIYAHRHLDSALGVRYNNENIVLNINDTELNENDCNIIASKFGTFPLLFNQFSLAGFDGILDDEKLTKAADDVLNNMVRQHRFLGADVTVPFASYMYFCKEDNYGLNLYTNSSLEAKKHLEAVTVAAF